MKKVNANLIYAINKHNKYNVVLFYITTRDGSIHTLINNSENMELAYDYDDMGAMVSSMERLLKPHGFLCRSICRE